MLTPEPEIDIAFGFDDQYAPHVSALIASIVRGAPGARFRFVMLHVGVAEPRQRLVESAAPWARFVWTEVGDNDVPAFADRAHFNRTTLFRLGLERLAPSDCHRLLYLDSDMIVLGDVRRLYEMSLGDLPLGAVPDAFVDPAVFGARWHLPPSPLPYFNAGVLLIDLDRVRSEGLLSKALAFVAEHDRDLPFNDQDALNWTFWGRWQPLPPSWNAQRDMVIPSVSKELAEHLQFHARLPNLVHFTGPEKPWSTRGYHPWSWIYWPNLYRTPFAGEVARTENMGWMEQLRLWIRWMRKRPTIKADDAPASARRTPSAAAEALSQH